MWKQDESSVFYKGNKCLNHWVISPAQNEDIFKVECSSSHQYHLGTFSMQYVKDMFEAGEMAQDLSILAI